MVFRQLFILFRLFFINLLQLRLYFLFLILQQFHHHLSLPNLLSHFVPLCLVTLLQSDFPPIILQFDIHFCLVTTCQIKL